MRKEAKKETEVVMPKKIMLEQDHVSVIMEALYKVSMPRIMSDPIVQSITEQINNQNKEKS